MTTQANNLIKIPITRGGVQPGDIIDGEPVTNVERTTDMTRLEFAGAGMWGDWVPSSWHISVYRVPTINGRILSAYRALRHEHNEWVSLTDLRPLLGDADTADVDAELKEMSRTRQADIVAESNRKTLTDADHKAAIWIGNEPNHLISIR